MVRSDRTIGPQKSGRVGRRPDALHREWADAQERRLGGPEKLTAPRRPEVAERYESRTFSWGGALAWQDGFHRKKSHFCALLIPCCAVPLEVFCNLFSNLYSPVSCNQRQGQINASAYACGGGNPLPYDPALPPSDTDAWVLLENVKSRVVGCRCHASQKACFGQNQRTGADRSHQALLSAHEL